MTTIIDGSAGITFPSGSNPQAAPAKIIQVVSGTYSTQVDTTSGSYVDTGLTATITPLFSTSKILILVNHQISVSSGSGYGNVALNRAGTNIAVFNANIIGGSTTLAVGSALSYVDSPATTSATIYKTQFQRVSSGGTFTSQQNGALASIVLLEIAQ